MDDPFLGEARSNARYETRKDGRRSVFLGAAVAGIFVFALWGANWWFLFEKPETARGTFGDMFGVVNALFSGLAFAGVVAAIILQNREMQESREEFVASAREQRAFYLQERRAHTRAVADALFREWWGSEMNELRRYFYLKFLPQHYALLGNCSMKLVEDQIAEDKGQLRRLTDFFDRVGWMGAAGLVDVDYVLGPMQHVMRRVWFATEPLILAARNSSKPGQLDPVFRLGFEWLFKRSSEPNKGHATLLAERFHAPELFPKEEALNLTQRIEQDEQEFHQFLAALRASPKPTSATDA